MRMEYFLEPPKVKHRTMMKEVRNPSDCDGELDHIGSAFFGDVSWEVFRCRKCRKKVYAVEGGAHWWNFEKEGEVV